MSIPFSAAAGAVKWVVDRVLGRQRDEEIDRVRRWDQVATWIDEVADTIEETVVQFGDGKLPWGPYAALCTLEHSVEGVLFRIYDRRLNADSFVVNAVRKLLRDTSSHVAVAEALPEIRPDDLVLLTIALGRLRALARTIKASA
jgi:hypothetical protein